MEEEPRSDADAYLISSTYWYAVYRLL